MIINLLQRHCDDEETEDSSSSDNSAGEEEAVLTKKSKGVNKIMDLPSVGVFDLRNLQKIQI